MPEPYDDKTFLAKDARLITRASADNAGLGDYIVKREFRRDLDQDIRREGYDYFWPAVSGSFATDPGYQPFPFHTTLKTLLAGTLTRSGTTATAVIALGHDFVEGETVRVAGAVQSPYNGAFVISNVTSTSFQYTMLSDPGATGTGTITVRLEMPIILITEVRRPNGMTALVVGTKTKLWRFYAGDEGLYIEGVGGSPYYDGDYYESNTGGEWLMIGNNFSINGHRWEHLTINGYLVLNNGVDLPVTYREEDSWVVPIYELRENGVAAVGTIGETNGILMVADISEIIEEELTELFGNVGETSSGEQVADQATSTVTTDYEFFTADMVGKFIQWSDLTLTQISTFTSSIQVTVNTSATVTRQTFTLRTKAEQVGATFSGAITASVGAGATLVTASGNFFDILMVGYFIRFTDGFEGSISGSPVPTPTQIGLNVGPVDAITNRQFWVGHPTNAFVVNAESDIFTEDMVGLKLFWEDGTSRTIEAFIDAQNVRVDSDEPQALGFIMIQNPDSYTDFSDASLINRIQYRVLWAMPDEPRRFGSSVNGSITSGTDDLVLAWPMKSFEVGQELIITGAGVSAGNLTATITAISSSGLAVTLSANASTTATNQPVARSDAPGSIVGFQDLQDDGSAVLRLLKLKSAIVAYKDTAMFIGVYTGNVDNPFDFASPLRMPQSMTLRFRWTLVDIGGQFHIYAAENSFYRFDLTTRVPEIVMELDLVADVFFNHAIAANNERIFAVDNAQTDEVWFQFPVTSGSDKGICFDYKQKSVSTTAFEISAGGSVEKPLIGAAVGKRERWFLMGLSTGNVLMYGKVSETHAIWNAKQIFYLRGSSYPYLATKGIYNSNYESGIGNLGDAFNEKDLRNYVLHLASQSINTEAVVTLYGYRNPSDTATALVAYAISSPQTKNLIPTFYRYIYFKEALAVSGQNNPVRIVARTFDASRVRSLSHPRRP